MGIYKYHSEYLVPGEGLFDYGYDYPYAYSALMGAMVNDPQYARSNWGNWEQVSAMTPLPSGSLSSQDGSEIVVDRSQRGSCTPRRLTTVG